MTNKKASDSINLEQIILSSYDSILVTDKNGNVLLANPACGKLLGKKPEELMGKNVKELIKAGVYERSTALEAATKKTVITGMVRTGRGINLMSTSTPLLDKDGEVVLVVTNTRDNDLVTKYMAALEEERKKADQYKTAVEYLSKIERERKDPVAESPKMRKIIESIKTIAKTDSTVLLIGETGTGKEVMARYIHRQSSRYKEPFIPVNCAAIPAHLLESEFFGYVKGAFTGASSQGKPGLFEIADKGTLFLDEVGELPLALQSKLLRVLETGEVQRLGSAAIHRTNVRLIAATNRDLQGMINQKAFRSDLYYRLNVIPLHLPPLRERPEDIIMLAHRFLDELNRKYAMNKEYTPQAIQAFLKYKWPGNVRELRNVVERLVITTPGDQLDFPETSLTGTGKGNPVVPEMPPPEPGNYQGTLRDVLKSVEKQYINQVIGECGGKLGEAAKRLGIHRTMLYRKLHEDKGKE